MVWGAIFPEDQGYSLAFKSFRPAAGSLCIIIWELGQSFVASGSCSACWLVQRSLAFSKTASDLSIQCIHCVLCLLCGKKKKKKNPKYFRKSKMNIVTVRSFQISAVGQNTFKKANDNTLYQNFSSCITC